MQCKKAFRERRMARELILLQAKRIEKEAFRAAVMKKLSPKPLTQKLALA